MMKVFISHKNNDSMLALNVSKTLKQNNVDTYLDLLDDNTSANGEQLTNHIKEKMNECTDLLVVLSENTKLSWWVPFEIGMAAQKDFPTVNYLNAGIELPSYLSYWPRLRNDSDLIRYIQAREKIRRDILQERQNNFFGSTLSETKRFYNELKSKLL